MEKKGKKVIREQARTGDKVIFEVWNHPRHQCQNRVGTIGSGTVERVRGKNLVDVVVTDRSTGEQARLTLNRNIVRVYHRPEEK